MPPIARGQTWLFQPSPVSTVPKTGRNQSDNSGYRGLDDEEEAQIMQLIEVSDDTTFLPGFNDEEVYGLFDMIRDSPLLTCAHLCRSCPCPVSNAMLNMICYD